MLRACTTRFRGLFAFIPAYQVSSTVRAYLSSEERLANALTPTTLEALLGTELHKKKCASDGMSRCVAAFDVVLESGYVSAYTGTTHRGKRRQGPSSVSSLTVHRVEGPCRVHIRNFRSGSTALRYVPYSTEYILDSSTSNIHELLDDTMARMASGRPSTAVGPWQHCNPITIHGTRTPEHHDSCAEQLFGPVRKVPRYLMCLVHTRRLTELAKRKARPHATLAYSIRFRPAAYLICLLTTAVASRKI